MRSLSPLCRAFILATISVGAVVLLWALQRLPDSQEQWIAFVMLTSLAAVAQLFPVVTPKNQAYEVTPVFIFSAIFILPPGTLASLIVLAYLPQWIKTKKAWYIQSFNTSICLVQTFAARRVYLWFDGDAGGNLTDWTGLVGAVAAAGVFTVLNHLLLATVLGLARGHSWRETRLLEPEYFVTDGALLCTGVITALLWQASPWLICLTAAPLFLIYRALNTPNLQEQARTDAKTGLYNARYFYMVLQEELRRAERFDRPISVIMADLDLLRNINNSYGHLAGDTVLRGVADIIRQNLREQDVAARFGGEEFSIMLPECDAEQALSVAERIRKRVEEARFNVVTSVEPIRATMSLGVAAFPADGREADAVIHQADLAVYYAKLLGRNRTWGSSPESQALASTMATRVSVSPVEARAIGRGQYIDRMELNMAGLRLANEELAKAHDEAVSTLEELRATYHATLVALSAALDGRDAETDGHRKQVVEYARAIALQLGLPGPEIANLVNGALFHDVGNIRVPDSILKKAGPLTEAEWAIIRTHPQVGYRMMRQMGFMKDALPVVRYHHERFDGQGYPEGLSGEQIPLGARIFAVADAIDAMTSDRPYRAACPLDEARKEILLCAGTQFDPGVVEALMKLDLAGLAEQSDGPVPPAPPAEGRLAPVGSLMRCD